MTAPTLIIGLGGTGSDIVSRIEKEYREKGERIGFAIFDTDANELRKIKNAGFSGALVQTSENLTVGEYLNSDPDAGEIWFPVHTTINRKTLTEGAGQVRAISRLAFEAMLRAGGMEVLHQEIDNLYRLNSEDLKQSLRIVIVSSLAGGTGSGLILPMGMYLRNYLIETYQQYSSIIRGFFIMPEIFNRVSKNPSERNSLQANTYAAMRELNAFLMRGDGSLEERFTKTIRFEIPKAGSMEKVSLNVMPYDYCFLFDKRSCNNEVLTSFEEYKELAVESVKALALEETSKRINSSEDNIIKELCEEIGRGGCNRYCGFGTAKLVYPYEDIVSYLADIWALDSLGQEWLKFDKEFEKRREQENRMMKVGMLDKMTSRKDVYFSSVSAAEKDSLSVCVERQSREESDAGKAYKWELYRKSLLEKIDDFYLGKGTKVAEYREDITNKIEEVSTAHDLKYLGNELLSKTREYREFASAFISNHGKELVTVLFHTESSNEKYQINYWLKSRSDENYMHPVTMRYFLYQLPELFQASIRQSQNRLDDVNRRMKTFETTLDNKKTDVVEDRDTATEALTEAAKPKSTKHEEQRELLKKVYEKDETDITDIIRHNMRIKVLEEGLRFVESMIAQYELFFESLNQLIEKIEDEKKGIEEYYNRNEGRTTRYVAMTGNCRKAYAKMISGKNNAVSVDAELCNTIMNSITEFCVQRVYNDEMTIADFYRKMAASMRSYWRSAIKDTFASVIDINVLEAIMKEAEYESKYGSNVDAASYVYSAELEEELNSGENGKEEYVSRTLEKMWKLSTPFIPKPVGEEPRTIRANCYHSSLEKDPKYRQLVNSCLKDHGGVKSDETDRYSIRFVQAIYGLSLTDFGKFSANRAGTYSPDKSQEGSLFAAYYEMVNNIHPNSKKTPCLSPHLDRTWHYINVMPEIDAGEQHRIELEICEAMIYSLVLNCITNRLKTKYASSFRYSLNFAEDELSCNDDVCDTFAEILQALIRNHRIVDRIMKDAQVSIRSKITAAKDLNRSYLYECLNNFQIREIDRLLESKMVREISSANQGDASQEALKEASEKSLICTHSILEMGLLYSQTATKEDYDETFALTLIQAAFKVLEDTIHLYLNNEDDVRYCLSAKIVEQYMRFDENLDRLNALWPDIRLEPMAEQTRLLTGQKLRDLGCYEEAEWILGNLRYDQYEKLIEERKKEAELRKMLSEKEEKAAFESYSSSIVNEILGKKS